MGLRGRLRAELERPVAAQAARAPWALGLAALGLLSLVALTGLGVALGFDPQRLPGLFARGLLGALRTGHAWAASLVLVLVLAHLLRGALTAAYRSPRRGTWLAGLGALGALLVLFWLGTALRGDQQGYEAWRHGVLLLGLAGLHAPTAEPFAVLFWLHVLAVPALLVAALAVHLRRVRRLDLAPLPQEAGRTGKAAASVPFRAHLLEGARLASMMAGLVVLLSVLVPPSLGPEPLPILEAARPPWPFAWLVPLQDAVGTWGILLGLALLFGALAALPWLDQRGVTLRDRAVPLALLAVLLALVVALGLWALLGPEAVRVVG